jgi:predicted dehydrogenase
VIAIFGHGFGLYGHLPALAELGHDIYLPLRYRPAFDERAELETYRSTVHFIDDEATLLSKAKLAVLVRRPADNEAIARQAATTSLPPQLVIEKPLATTPQAALALDSALREAHVRYATPYLFAYCDWARNCENRIRAGQGVEITLDWYFNSPKTTESWKAKPEDGGGPLNYYFIHVIALAGFFLGDYRLVECWANSEGRGRKIRMTAVSGAPRFAATFCTGTVDSNFSVAIDGVIAYNAETPFGDVPRRGDRDPRINVLKRFYASEVFCEDADPVAAERGRQTLKCWAEVVGRLRHENTRADQ